MKQDFEKLSMRLRLAAYLLKIGKELGHWTEQQGYPQKIINYYIREE